VNVWITKYALTSGIFEADVDEPSDEWPDSIDVRGDGVSVFTAWYHKPHWHTSAEAANARAEEMRQAKIASHRKAIAKLEKMRFE